MSTCPVEGLPLVPLAAPHHPLRPDHHHDDGDDGDGDDDDDDGDDGQDGGRGRHRPQPSHHLHISASNERP